MGEVRDYDDLIIRLGLDDADLQGDCSGCKRLTDVDKTPREWQVNRGVLSLR